MILEVPWSPLWQGLLDGLGWVVAQIYDFVPNYGLTIILLTIVIRVVLLPLGIKQVRSMQHMQIVQPKVKQIQQKFKGNKQRQQEEIMKLYKEFGVNPFSGCWPVLLQFPILIAMYSVLRWPQHPIHIPADSELYAVVTQQIPPVSSPGEVPPEPGSPSGTGFLGMNLLCSASQAGNPDSKLSDRITVEGESVEVGYPVNCGEDVVDRIPYYVFAALMFATTFFQQRQMQSASPPGSSQQQQALLKVMPILFGVFGIFFPAGLVLYWTTSNGWQIGQQYFMLKSRPTEEQLAATAKAKPQKAEKKGFMASMMERAEQGRGRKGGANPGPGKPGQPKPGQPKPKRDPRNPGSGGSGGGGDPKKRPKR
jgi:YidC/Oxa1 family membrane protein insertase